MTTHILEYKLEIIFKTKSKLIILGDVRERIHENCRRY